MPWTLARFTMGLAVVGAMSAQACLRGASDAPHRSTHHVIDAVERALSADHTVIAMVSPRDAFARVSGVITSEGFRSVAQGRYSDLAVRASEFSDEPMSVGVSRFDSTEIQVSLAAGARVPAVLSEGRVVYHEVFPDTDRVLLSSSSRLEELLVLRA